MTDPERKRKIIGAEFVRVFEEEAKKLPDIRFLAQGTIYPDVIESGGSKAATIKSHHNVGGLPKDMGFEAWLNRCAAFSRMRFARLAVSLACPEALSSASPSPAPASPSA